MRVLLLSNRVPFPPHGGYSIVVYNTIKELVELGCDVTLFSLNSSKHFVRPDRIKDPLLDSIKFSKYRIDTRVNIRDAFLNLFTNKSYNISRFYDVGCASKLAHLLRKNEYDIIQLEGLQVTPYYEVIKANSNAKIIYRSHNIEHQIWKKLSVQENFPLKKVYLGLLSKRLQSYEHNVINNFDALLAISTVDEHFFKSIGCQVPIHTFPVGLNLNNYHSNFNLTPHKSIGYIGSMDWRPNEEGLKWFLHKVWPSIQNLRTDIKFHLAGKNLPEHYVSTKNFIVEGEVDNALEFIAKQHVFIVPLLSGSGMRVKIIEAMALGKCVIATSIAAEGIAYQHDKNILIADKADDFYKQILRCFTDKTLIHRIGAQASQLIREHHDNLQISRQMLQVYKELRA